MASQRPKLEPVPLPEELRAVPRTVLEAYVLERARQLVRVVAERLTPNVGAQAHALVEDAFQQATQLLGMAGGSSSPLDNVTLRFRHRCRFIGCMAKECVLCRNNPCKRCKDEDNFDECYADNQVLRSKCEADIHLELVNNLTGVPQHVPGLELQVCVIDGDSWSDVPTASSQQPRRLLKSDEGSVLLNSMASGTRPDAEGYLTLKMQDGLVKLPDMVITDKNDTFHTNGESYSTFRILARAIKRDLYGRAVPLDNLAAAVSNKFVVKTQRALNDYRKSEYPHYKDELTKLKFIGSITAQRLREIQSHLGLDVPFTSIETVEQLKHLMLYADQNRVVESKLLELLNMKGKHKSKWEYLRHILSENVVYDDMAYRAWFASDDNGGTGLLFASKQGQINMDKPIGMFRRVQSGGQVVMQVYATGQDPASADMIRLWRSAAEQAWCSHGHGRWTLVNERIEVITGTGPPQLLASPSVSGQLGTGGTMSPSMSVHEGLNDQQVMYVRQGIMASPRSPSDTPSDHHRRISQGAHSMSHNALDMGAAAQAGLPGAPALSVPVYSYHPGASPSGAPSSMPEMYRAPSGIDPNTGAFMAYSPGSQLSLPSSIGGHGGLSPRGDQPGEPYHRSSSREGERPSTRSYRARRPSAEAGSGAARAGSVGASQERNSAPQMLNVAHAPHANEALYKATGMPDAGMLKRPRTSAPSGLAPVDDTGSGRNSGSLPRSTGSLQPGVIAPPPPPTLPFGLQPMDVNAAEQQAGRHLLYHFESQGRHLPMARKSHDTLAPSDSTGIAGVFDEKDLELDALLHGMDSGALHPGFGVKQEDAGASVPGMGGPGGGAGSALGGLPGLHHMGGHAGGVSLSLQHLIAMQQQGMGMGHMTAQHMHAMGLGGFGGLAGHPGLMPRGVAGMHGGLSLHHGGGGSGSIPALHSPGHHYSGAGAGMHPHAQSPGGSTNAQQNLGQPSLSFELATGIQHALHLGETGAGPGSGGNAAPGSGGVGGGGGGESTGAAVLPAGVHAGTPPERQPMMMMPDSDSFKSLSRVLRRTDSDTFKNLMCPTLPYGAPQDAGFDRTLQDFMHGRVSSSM